MRYIKDPRIPDELCGEIYLQFLDRMKNYRKKQLKGHKKAHIEGGIIGRMIQRVTQNVLKENYRQEQHDQILSEIVNRNASQLWLTKKSSKEREFFYKIACFLKDWAQAKTNRPFYLRVFLLYHSFHLSPEFLDILLDSTDINAKELKPQLEEMKEIIRDKANSQLDKKVNSLGKNYFYLIKKQKNVAGLSIKQFGSKEEEEEYYRVKRNRAQAYKAIREQKFVPSFVQIEKITGISERKARYAYQTVTKAIKESFKDDTYWGKTS